MRDDQKATMNGPRLALHTQSDSAEPDNPPHNNSVDHLAERVIAALRRGLGCGVMISEDETLH